MNKTKEIRELREEKRKRIIENNRYCISCGTEHVEMIQCPTFNILDLLLYGHFTQLFRCRCRCCWSEWNSEKW